MSTEVIVHEPTHDATIRVHVRRKLDVPISAPVTGFAVICYHEVGAPPLLVMTSQQFTREGASMLLHPGGRAELVGEARLLKSHAIFHAPVAWGIAAIKPESVTQEDFEITGVFVDGHPLITPPGE